ncbi:MAG: hypothetical protein H7Z37_13000, partial [Pyrinomonadaceae bacterium]|nr:hypothetical protein [Pyrinomonadaceae bacterium]
PATSAPTTIPSAGATSVTVTNVTVVSDDAQAAAQAQIPPRSRNDLTNTKSAVFRILPDGGNEIVWSSTTITAFSIVANPNNNGVLLGTSDKGRIYSVTNDGRETLLTQSNEGQISTIKTRGADVFATSSNGGKLFKFNGETVAEGSYESIVRDAKFSALWGRIWWRTNGNVEFQTHTGNTDKPDTTWSDWQTVTKNGDGGQIQSPKARFLQWRVILRNSATISEVSVSYLPRNVAPEITNIQISPTNVGLQSNATPPADPNIENSGVDPSVFGVPPVAIAPPRKLYQRGAVSIQWTAEDRNSDKLEHAIYYRGANEQTFILLKDKLRDNFYTIDGATLSDGLFFVKIVTNDSPSNPFGQSLSSERISEPFNVDNTSPIVQSVGTPQVNGEKVRAVFEVSDTANIIRKAEISVDGGDWYTAFSDDGISDSSRERFTVEAVVKGAGEHTISLRAFDANGNVGSTRINVRR